MTDNSQLATLARSRRPKKHAHHFIETVWGGVGPGPFTVPPKRCDICGLPEFEYEARVRRGRTSLRAGKDGERAIAKAYGGRRVGQYGGASDVEVGELFSVQSKVGWFSNRFWDELAKLPRTGGRIPTLIVSDRPGPGRRTRRLVIRTLEDDIALHGEKR